MSDDFIAEFENMDLSELLDKQFIVAVSTGDRNKCKLLASTIHGPYSFYEMAEMVGNMYKEHQHHAKVTVLDKNPQVATVFLDENTTDYIEAKYEEIIADAILLGELDTGKEYTCKASLITGREQEQTEESDEEKDESN